MDGKSSKLGMSLCTSWKRIILICVCGWHKIGWKDTKSWSDVETTQKEVDLGEPTSFLDHVYLGCTQRQCEISKDVVDNNRTMFESRISAGGAEKSPFPQSFLFLLHGLMVWKVMQWNLWSDTVSYPTRRRNNSIKYLLHASMTTTSRKKKWNLVENCHKYSLKLFWNAFTWHLLETWYSMVSK